MILFISNLLKKFFLLAAPYCFWDLSWGDGGGEPMPPAVQVRSPNPWTAREFPLTC